jgi:hypothetical protein
MTKTNTLANHLHAAYDWIDSAGEWDQAISNPAQYAREAAANAAEHDESDVTESDLLDAIAFEAAKTGR